ncbi:MAG TPA: hypothetical protein VF727_09980 [Allosphingosinicella sp.]|jgi:hypothetical protein
MRHAAIGALFTAALSIAACQTYYDEPGRSYGGYRYMGDDYDRRGNDCGFFEGSGGDLLDPWLACTREGQRLVRDMFDDDDDRRLTAETADRANVWFRVHADTNRDRCLTDREVRAALVAGGHAFRRRY